MLSYVSYSQNIDFDQFSKEKWLRYTIGKSAATVCYDGTVNKQDLTCLFISNLNFKIVGEYNILLLFSYFNKYFDSQNLFKFNKLSIYNPYRWIIAKSDKGINVLLL